MITFLRTILSVVLLVAMTALAPPLATSSLAASPKAKAIQLDDAAKADIARIEAYMNSLTTLRTRFVQVSDSGQSASGVLTISRPGKMRFSYDPPSPIMLLADGTFLIYIDRQLGQTTHVFLSKTPVGLLVGKDIKLNGTVAVTAFERRPGVIRVTVTKTDEPEEGTITLVFADGPLALRQWIVVDSQGSQTSITLDDLEYGVKVDPKMFVYDKPIEVPRN